MPKIFPALAIVLFLFFARPSFAAAQSALASPSPVASPVGSMTALPSPEPSPTPSPTPRPDLTQTTEETVGPLEKLLNEQVLGPVLPFNLIKYAIRAAVTAGVPANTIVLLLLLPLVAAVIAAARHIIGLRGFGILLPAALSVAFVAVGPVVGLILFLTIVASSIFLRTLLKKGRIRLQYLPRMAMILWFVVVCVLLIFFFAPLVAIPGITNISIFPVLILVLLAEDFTRVQLGKSARIAINLTTETIVLALVCYVFLTWQSLQRFALLSPELFLGGVALFNFFTGKFIGLRFREYWRFRKLLTG